MLKSVRQTMGRRVLATDGEIGRVTDVYFDDEQWVVRYLVVGTGGWLTRRDVLISPYSVRLIEDDTRSIVVALTREQVKDSPDIDTAKPVSRQQEAELFRYYGYPAYWPHTTYWAWGAVPVVEPVPPPAEQEETLAEAEGADSHLRSSDEVLGYHIQASDGPIGHIEDLLFDEETWAIRHLVVDTRNWWPGKQVLVSPELARDVDWAGRTLSLSCSREAVKSSPEYDPDKPPPSGGVSSTRLGRAAHVVLLGAAFLLATGSPEAAESEQASIPFATSSGIQGWRAVSDATLYIRGRNDQWYRADLAGPCIGLQFDPTIGFVVRHGSTFDRSSSVLVEGRECRLTSLVAVEGPPDEVEDARARSGRERPTKDEPQERSAGQAAAASEAGPGAQTQIPFADLGGIRDWRAVSDQVLYVQGRGQQWYRVDLTAPCTGLRFEEAIGFVAEPTGAFDRFSSIVVDGRECQVASLTPSPPPRSRQAEGVEPPEEG